MNHKKAGFDGAGFFIYFILKRRKTFSFTIIIHDTANKGNIIY